MFEPVNSNYTQPKASLENVCVCRLGCVLKRYKGLFELFNYL